VDSTKNEPGLAPKPRTSANGYLIWMAVELLFPSLMMNFKSCSGAVNSTRHPKRKDAMAKTMAAATLESQEEVEKKRRGLRFWLYQD